MTVREYIGARYVPLFVGEWRINRAYEPLSVVTYQGASYTSRRAVPMNVPITNEVFWAISGNYNAQVEAYRQEVFTFDGRIDALEGKFPVDTADIADDAVTADKIADDAVTADAIADDAVTTDTIADGAVTNGKIANGAVNTSKIADASVTLAKLDSAVLESIILTELVIFGDSWSDPDVTDAVWGAYLGNKLNLTVHNYAKNAARVASTQANNINAQVDTAQADTSYNHNKVKYCVILGGINDYRHETTKQDLADAAVAIIARCKTLYPNATILFATNCAYPMTMDSVRYFSEVTEYVRTTSCVQVVDLNGYFTDYYFNTSNWYHLTQAGSRQMAGIFATLLRGGTVDCPVIRQTLGFGSGNIGQWIVQKVKNCIHWSLILDIDLSVSTMSTGEIAIVGNQLCAGDTHIIGACVPSGTTDSKIVFDIQQTEGKLVIVNPADTSTNGKAKIGGIAY